MDLLGAAEDVEDAVDAERVGNGTEEARIKKPNEKEDLPEVNPDQPDPGTYPSIVAWLEGRDGGWGMCEGVRSCKMRSKVSQQRHAARPKELRTTSQLIHSQFTAHTTMRRSFKACAVIMIGRDEGVMVLRMARGASGMLSRK
jgi:hypothetical protein